MFGGALQTVGTALLPYLVQGAVDLGQSFISQTLGNSKQGVKQVLGQCATGFIDTFGNRYQIDSAKLKQLKKQQKRQEKDRYRSSRIRQARPTQLIVPDQMYQEQQYNAPQTYKQIPQNGNRQYEMDFDN